MINSINTATQTIDQKSSTIVPTKSPPPVEESNVVRLRQVEEKKQVDELKQVEEKKNPLEKAAQPDEKAIEEKKDEKKDEKISQEMLDELASDIETLHSIGLSFAQHEDSGRTMVEVMDKDTNTLIRQIPSEDVLNMAAKMDEMIGMLFDEKV